VLLARITAGSRWSRGAVPGTRWASSLSSQVEMPATGSQRRVLKNEARGVALKVEMG
jgi:hypothetical protein